MFGSFTWGIYALLASMIWGIVYVLEEKLLKAGITPIAIALFFSVISLPIYIALFLTLKDKKADIQLIIQNPSLMWSIIIVSVLFVVSNILILFAVQEKNATLVSFIEISYPIFTFLFAMWILGDVQLTPSTLMGAALIALGSGIVLLKG